jgi:hypothetical protein
VHADDTASFSLENGLSLQDYIKFADRHFASYQDAVSQPVTFASGRWRNAVILWQSLWLEYGTAGANAD